MRRLEEYVSTGGSLLRCGYTTGTCAAAATRAAADLLLANELPPAVCIQTPAGIHVVADVEKSERGDGWARCAVRKDAGDDPDVTDGVLVWAEVRRKEEPGVTVLGGEGVGVVTKPGLDQPPGSAAINSVPRAMIREAAQESACDHGYEGGLGVCISIPAGVELAKRTFNPRLGIEGGISVLGTTGIVRPMSEDALVSSIKLELAVRRGEGAEHVLVVPGNYGKTFARDTLGLDVRNAVVCSNYLGETIDETGRLGFSSMLVVGHIGKLAKVAAGVMNTHSRVADCRAEAIATHAALAGADAACIRSILEAPTTDAMLDVLAQQGMLQKTMASLVHRLGEHLHRRAADSLCVEAIVFSNQYGLLGCTKKLTRGLTRCHIARDVTAGQSPCQLFSREEPSE